MLLILKIFHTHHEKKSNNSKIHMNTNIHIFPANCRRAQPYREQAHLSPHKYLRHWSQHLASTPNLGEKSGTFLIGSAES